MDLPSPLVVGAVTLVIAVSVHVWLRQNVPDAATTTSSAPVANPKKKKKPIECFLEEDPALEQARADSAQVFPLNASVCTTDGRVVRVKGYDAATQSYTIEEEGADAPVAETVSAAALVTPEVQDFFIYPIKSCRGVRLDTVKITQQGILHDRAWMFIDTTGKFISQRRYPKMACIVPKLINPHDENTAAVVLTAEGMDDLVVPIISEGQGTEMQVRLWADRVQTVDQGDAAAAWINEYLKESRGRREFRLVRMKKSFQRATDPAYAPGHDTLFPDGFPFLVAAHASIDKLNESLEEKIPMDRFRPNIVLKGAPAFADEHWNCFIINGLRFRNIRPCARCSMPCVDQLEGVANPAREPQKTLTRLRNGVELGFINGKENESYFGSNLIVNKPGTLHVGDAVKVLTMKTAVYA
ncbi:TPA: hypothetical protein N0F65_003787 [Lagenidium giganteum]|uniref:MOSC domain-containing protein n=1 Tax=Lagenidium giganteum TaxID=4803 RepID=A0AAV2YH60_9STRA|nr:TPA: hypothetical protein N0F65_003787 [Lagenidium giganteum]